MYLLIQHLDDDQPVRRGNPPGNSKLQYLEDGVLCQGTTSKGTFATVDGSEIRRSPHGMVLKPCK